MIKKTILVAVLLFVFYAIFVVAFAPKWWSASQHQWQDNIIKAQKFMYNDKDTFTNVIVGSSLSCRLIMDSIPQTFNLSFGGQSVFDGLSILSNTSRLPKNVFIEMNFILRKEDKDFTSFLGSPILFYPKKVLPSLREDKKPIGIIGNQVSYKITAPLIKKLRSVFHLTQRNTSNRSQLFSKMLEIQSGNYSKSPSEVELNESFNILKKYVSYLHEKGVNIVFFEMPVNFELVNLPKANIIRRAFYESFPKSKYYYISLQDSVKYRTTDGVHLNNDEALEYTIYFKQKMKNYFHE